MKHLSLYRKYRPITWEQVVGQNHIVRSLRNQINSNNISHAYLFTGSRGTGKTSSAKVFARAVNCLNPQNGSPCNQCEVCKAILDESCMDVIELDAASNNGVDDIRSLTQSVMYPPTLAKYKVYIVDEVHMLSTGAFNSFLKTLEEPPEYTIFILATTEVHKLPSTILSRCMRFDFRLIPTDELAKIISDIFDKENYKYEKEACTQIAIHAEGSARDCLSIADMCMAYSLDNLTYDDVLEVLGASDFESLFRMTNALLAGNIPVLLECSDEVSKRGKGISTLNRELANFVKNLISIKNVPRYKVFSSDETIKALELANKYDNYKLGRVLEIIASIENNLRYSSQPKILFEASLIKAAELITDPSIEALNSRISKIESMIKSFQNDNKTYFKDFLKTNELCINTNPSVNRTKIAENIAKSNIDDVLPFEIAENNTTKTKEKSKEADKKDSFVRADGPIKNKEVDKSKMPHEEKAFSANDKPSIAANNIEEIKYQPEAVDINVDFLPFDDDIETDDVDTIEQAGNINLTEENSVEAKNNNLSMSPDQSNDIPFDIDDTKEDNSSSNNNQSDDIPFDIGDTKEDNSSSNNNQSDDIPFDIGDTKEDNSSSKINQSDDIPFDIGDTKEGNSSSKINQSDDVPFDMDDTKKDNSSFNDNVPFEEDLQADTSESMDSDIGWINENYEAVNIDTNINDEYDLLFAEESKSPEQKKALEILNSIRAESEKSLSFISQFLANVHDANMVNNTVVLIFEKKHSLSAKSLTSEPFKDELETIIQRVDSNMNIEIKIEDKNRKKTADPYTINRMGVLFGQNLTIVD